MIGDTKHGRGEHNKLFREKFGVHRLLLHAHKISFVHPVSKKRLEINAKVDEIFQGVLENFGWENRVL